MAVSRADLQRFLNGHRVANARIREELVRRLRGLTVDEARAEYDALCRVWEASHTSGDTPALDRLVLEHRVALRRRLAGRRR